MNCGDCLRICCCDCKCCCPVKSVTDRYAHIEYRPAETAHRDVSDHELVAIQREPVQSYHLQPKLTSALSDSKPSHKHSQSWSSSVITDEKSQPEERTGVSEPEKPRRHSKTFSSFTSYTKQRYHMEPVSEQTPESKSFHHRSRMLSTASHESAVTEQPRRSKSLKRPRSVTPYWMTGNESPAASREAPGNSSPVDDTGGVLGKRADQQRSFPTDLVGSQQIPTDSLTSAAVSHAAVLSADESQPPRVPILQFSMQHDSEDNTLTVHLIQAEHLPAKDIGGASDPFVKLSLESNVCESFESKVIHRTLNPRFNQHFKFTNLPPKIHHEKLVFEIYDYDRISINDFIGEVRVLLRKELLSGDTITMRVDELAMELRVWL